MPSKRSSVIIGRKHPLSPEHGSKKVGIIVQARMGSTRLPGKVLRIVGNKPLLQILLGRLKRVKPCDIIVVATTVDPKDDPIEELCKELRIDVFRGSEQDVLSRYYLAAKEHDLDVVVRITGDCPVMDPRIVGLLIEQFLAINKKRMLDYASNTQTRSYPRGMDVEVFSFKALKTAYNEAKQQYQREHVTPFIWENARRFKLHNIKWDHDGSKVRLTVDTQEDLDLILAINDILIGQGKALESATLDDIMEILNKNPVLLKINAHVEQKSHKEVELKKGPKIKVPISKRGNKQ